MADKELASAGHRLGQLVGDWFEEFFVLPLLRKVADQLKLFLVDRVRGALGALPQEIRIIAQQQSKPAVFETIADATVFLQGPKFDFSKLAEKFIYEITYTDGAEFDRTLGTI